MWGLGFRAWYSMLWQECLVPGGAGWLNTDDKGQVAPGRTDLLTTEEALLRIGFRV